jgi:hypothetical protein
VQLFGLPVFSVSPTGSNRVSIEPIGSIAATSSGPAAPPVATNVVATPATRPPYSVVSKQVTPVMPPGYTQTQTIKADGGETTVITNATGGTVDTIYGTSTMEDSGSAVSVWA